jgi:hypothetical protein
VKGSHPLHRSLEVLDLVKHVGESSLRLMDKVHPAVKGRKMNGLFDANQGRYTSDLVVVGVRVGFESK